MTNGTSTNVGNHSSSNIHYSESEQRLEAIFSSGEKVPMYVDLLKHLEMLEHRLGIESLAYKQQALAFKEHPNLRAYLDHLGVVRLCTTDVNALVDSVDITHRTDDVGGSLEILPFINEKGGRLYSDPPLFVVGYRNPKGFGEVPLVDWRDLMEDAGIANEVQRKVQWYLKAHAPVNYEEVPD